MDRTGGGWGRRLSLLLLVANIILLITGLSLEYWRHQTRQLPGYNADRIQIVRTSRSHGHSLQADAQAQPATVSPVCFTVPLSSQDVYPALRQGLAQSGFDESTYHLTVDNRLGWWVYWPPVSDPVQQVRLIKRFQDSGVRDFAPIRRGPMTGAISLGMFAGEDDAQLRSEDLKRKGLDQVDYGPRPGTDTLLLSVTGDGVKRLDDLRKNLDGKVVLEDQPCPAAP